MKKFTKLFSKSFMLLLTISIACISLVACNKNKTATKTSTPATTITDNLTQDDQLNADHVSDNEESSIEKLEKLNGLYQIQSPVQVTDIYYEDLDKLLNFYNTRDLNGLYHILSEEQVLDLYTTNSGSLDWYFFFDDNGLRRAYYNKNADVYCILNSTPISYDNILIETNSDTIKLFVKCSYFSSSENKTIDAPFYVVSTIKHIEYSDNLFEDAVSYTFKNTPITINCVNESIDTNEALLKLAKICRVDEESETLQQDIIQTLLSWQFKISQDFDRLTISETSTIMRFAGKSDNNLYSFNGFDIELISRQIDLESSIESMTLKLLLDEKTSASFEISVK